MGAVEVLHQDTPRLESSETVVRRSLPGGGSGRSWPGSGRAVSQIHEQELAPPGGTGSRLALEASRGDPHRTGNLSPRCDRAQKLQGVGGRLRGRFHQALRPPRGPGPRQGAPAAAPIWAPGRASRAVPPGTGNARRSQKRTVLQAAWVVEIIRSRTGAGPRKSRFVRRAIEQRQELLGCEDG